MKKGQEFAIGTIIYLLVFFMILLVGTYGIHNRIAIESRAKAYQLTSLSEQEIVHDIKNIISSERRYALDKSLYLVGAFGGYYASVDLQKIPVCPSGYTIYNLTHCVDSGGDVIEATDFRYRNPNIEQCGTTSVKYEDGFDTIIGKYLPEREYGVPYFYTASEGECDSIKELDKSTLIKNVEGVARYFSELDPQVYKYLTERYGRYIKIPKHFILKIKDIDSNGIDYVWYPIDGDKIVVYDGDTPQNSSVVYSEPIDISGHVDSDFYKLFQSARDDIARVSGNDLSSVVDEVLSPRKVEFDFVTSTDCDRKKYTAINLKDGNLESGVQISDPECRIDYDSYDKAIRDLTDGKYNNIKELNETLYKKLLKCYADESLADCIKRKIIERMEERGIVLDDVQKRIIFDSIEVKNLKVEVDTKVNYYYEPTAYYGVSAKVIRESKRGVFSSYPDEDSCSTFYWPSFFEDPELATNLAINEHVVALKKEDDGSTVEGERSAYTQKESIVRVTNTGNQNIIGIKLVVKGYDLSNPSGNPIKYGEIEKSVMLRKGGFVDFKIVSNYVNTKTYKRCYNPNFGGGST